MIQVKRYHDPSPRDGMGILVDRLWPRGLKKEAAHEWRKDLAPSDALRRGFKHDPDKWSEFRWQYRKELSGRMAAFCDPASISIRNEKDDGESNLADDFFV
jgi:uncharacterized protein YeaO (DUF488 family)